MGVDRKEESSRLIYRFSVRSLLLLIVCVACYLAGHRAGFKTGYSKASAEYGAEFVSVSRSYDVSDLIIPLRD